MYNEMGLTPDMVAAAQKLADELAKSKNLLIPLDKYLESKTSNAGGKSK